jgi:hypothetical protein
MSEGTIDDPNKAPTPSDPPDDAGGGHKTVAAGLPSTAAALPLTPEEPIGGPESPAPSDPPDDAGGGHT